MLSVLWRKPDGSEEIFTAESVERLSGDMAQVPACGAFIAKGVDNSQIPGDEMQFTIEEPFGAVFVMNESGRTIARYTAAG